MALLLHLMLRMCCLVASQPRVRFASRVLRTTGPSLASLVQSHGLLAPTHAKHVLLGCFATTGPLRVPSPTDHGALTRFARAIPWLYHPISSSQALALRSRARISFSVNSPFSFTSLPRKSSPFILPSTIYKILLHFAALFMS